MAALPCELCSSTGGTVLWQNDLCRVVAVQDERLSGLLPGDRRAPRARDDRPSPGRAAGPPGRGARGGSGDAGDDAARQDEPGEPRQHDPPRALARDPAFPGRPPFSRPGVVGSPSASRSFPPSAASAPRAWARPSPRDLGSAVAMTNSTPPATRASGTGTLFTDARTCKEWLNALPLTNIPQAQQLVLDALRVMNRATDFDAARAPEVHGAAARQDRLPAGRAALALLRQDAAALAQRHQRVDHRHARCSRRWRTATASASPSPRSSRASSRATRRSMMQRVMRYLGAQMLFHAIVYRRFDPAAVGAPAPALRARSSAAAWPRSA